MLLNLQAYYSPFFNLLFFFGEMVQKLVLVSVWLLLLVCLERQNYDYIMTSGCINCCSFNFSSPVLKYKVAYPLLLFTVVLEFLGLGFYFA